MSPRNRRFGRKTLIGIALVALAAWLLPSFVSAERYRRRLEAGLEQALKRPATFGAVSSHLLPRPGFTIENVLVREDPQFGAEPFAHVERIDCDLRWRSLLRSRLSFSRLHLDRPTFNIVRNARGEWNVESLLLKSGIASPAAASGPRLRPPESLDLDVEDARIDFKIAEDKKPFAITELRARLNFDPSRGLLRYRLTGKPVRTDLSLPSPGELELQGDWTPGRNLEGPINATLRAEKSLLYDWVPLVTGRNPEIYGVMDLAAHLGGSMRVLTAEGDAEIGQLYRWDLSPPSDSTHLQVHFRGELDRALGRVAIETADAAFGDARLHLAGSVASVFNAPDLDLVLVIGRSRLDDVLTLGRRFWTSPKWLGASGMVDGILAIRGARARRQYGGLITAREVRVATPSGKVAVSDAVLRIETGGVRLAPVRLNLAPHLELVAEGTVGYPGPVSVETAKVRNSRNEPKNLFRINKSNLTSQELLPRPLTLLARHGDETQQVRPGGLQGDPGAPTGPVDPDGSGPVGPWYEVTLSAKAVPFADLVRFARTAGVHAIQGIEVRDGTASGVFHFDGSAWPPRPPSVDGNVEVEAVRLLLPGLSGPLDVPRAVVHVTGDRVNAFPVVATLGGSTFTGRLEHEGDWRRPWNFDLHTDRLSLERGALWFEVLGHRTAPTSILDRLPGLRSFDTRRAAAANLFGALNAKGVFRASAITYRSLTLANPEAQVEISGRVVRVTDASFRAAGGRGHATLEVDTTAQPARVSGEVAVKESSLQTLAPWLPISLAGLRGSLSGSGTFDTRGLTRGEMASHLEGEAALRLKDVSFGNFDLLETLVQQCRWGALEPSRKRAPVRSAALTFKVHDRRVLLEASPFELAGARLDAAGSYSFDGKLDLAVHTDFRHVARRWQAPGTTPASPTALALASGQIAGPRVEGQNLLASGTEARDQLLANIHLAGPLDRLEVVPDAQQSRLDPPKP